MQGYTPLEIDIRDRAARTSPEMTDLIRQMEDALTFLREHPGLPVDRFGSTFIRHFTATPGEVDEVAAQIGATPGWNAERTHYTATRPFGPNVCYEAIHITPLGKATYNALQSYDGNVQPDEPARDGRKVPVAA